MNNVEYFNCFYYICNSIVKFLIRIVSKVEEEGDEERSKKINHSHLLTHPLIPKLMQKKYTHIYKLFISFLLLSLHLCLSFNVIFLSLSLFVSLCLFQFLCLSVSSVSLSLCLSVSLSLWLCVSIFLFMSVSVFFSVFKYLLSLQK